MDKDRDTDLDREDEIYIEPRDDERDLGASKDTGEILGIARVPTGATGEIKRPMRGKSAGAEEGRITPLEDEVDLGARDVTKDGRGQTGPETGGHGSTPRRSGATGVDIG